MGIIRRLHEAFPRQVQVVHDMLAKARRRLPESSYAAKMYDFVKTEYDNNPDKDNWERTRDALYERYQAGSEELAPNEEALAAIPLGEGVDKTR